MRFSSYIQESTGKSVRVSPINTATGLDMVIASRQQALAFESQAQEAISLPNFKFYVSLPQRFYCMNSINGFVCVKESTETGNISVAFESHKAEVSIRRLYSTRYD